MGRYIWYSGMGLGGAQQLLVPEIQDGAKSPYWKSFLAVFFCFPIAFWASTSGGFRIGSDIFV